MTTSSNRVAGLRRGLITGLPQSTQLRGLARFVRAKPLGAVGAGIILFWILAALFAWALPYGPLEQELRARLSPPSWSHPFGTDELGRDLLTRIIYGARITLKIAVTGVLIGTGAGTVVGIVSGSLRGKVDIILQRMVDALMAFPLLILALALASIRPPSDTNTLVIIGIVLIPSVSRVVRGATLGVMSNVYIEAARALGASWPRIMLRHILPNVTAPIIVVVSIFIGAAIIVESSLAFLGVSGSIDRPSWGAMLSGAGRDYVETAWWLAAFPGLALASSIYAFNLLGDALRDVLDPRLRGGGRIRG